MVPEYVKFGLLTVLSGISSGYPGALLAIVFLYIHALFRGTTFSCRCASDRSSR